MLPEKDADGNTLPPAPKDKKDKASASATKRKRGDSSSSESSSSSAEAESESEPEQKTKPRQKRIKATASGARRKAIKDSKEAKRIHAATAAKAQQDHWFEDESEAELGSDFQCGRGQPETAAGTSVPARTNAPQAQETFRTVKLKRTWFPAQPEALYAWQNEN